MAAVEHIRAVDHAGVTLVGRKNVVRSLAATDGHPLVLDNIQRHCLEGPCYEPAVDQVTRVDDLTVESRWPTFVKRALAATPIRSILKYPLFANHTTTAALYLYSNRAGTLDDDVESLGVLFADHAARALKAGQGRQRPIAVPGGPDVVDEATQMLVDAISLRLRNGLVHPREPFDRTPSTHRGHRSPTDGNGQGDQAGQPLDQGIEGERSVRFGGSRRGTSARARTNTTRRKHGEAPVFDEHPEHTRNPLPVDGSRLAPTGVPPRRCVDDRVDRAHRASR